MRFSLILMGLFMLTAGMVEAQSSHKLLRKADQLYKNGQFNQAETEYRKADALKPGTQSKYNLGNSIYSQNRYDEAAKSYQDAITSASSEQEKASVYYNLGNAYYQNKKYEESIQAYKKSLEYQSQDMATKENLALARRELQKIQQKQQQQQDQQNQDKDKEDKDNQQQNQNQQDQNQEQNQDNKENSEQQDQQKGDEKNTNMTKEEAKKLLEIMDEEEKKIQQNMRRSGERVPPKKNW